MPSSTAETQDSKAAFARLKEELFMTRRAMINLMHEDARRILMGSYDVQTLGDVADWAEHAASAMLDLCHPQPAESMGGSRGDSARAACPLCGGDSSGPDDVKGFAVPEGIIRHLLGTYNARQCPVFEAAVAQARAQFDMAI